MQMWKTLERRTVLDRGKFLRVEEHTVELPDGRVISDWPWVITPDFVTVVVVTEQGDFLLFRQPKYAVAGVSLALIGGYLEPGEEPRAAAERELLEETGYQAAEWIDLGQYAVDGNRGGGRANFFLALGARSIDPRNADDLEEQEPVILSRDETREALERGEFKVLPWAAAVALALLRL